LNCKQSGASKVGVVQQAAIELSEILVSRSGAPTIAAWLCTPGAVNGLLSIRRIVEENDGQLKLCEMHGLARETVQLLNLEGTLCEVYDSRSEALDPFITGCSGPERGYNESNERIPIWMVIVCRSGASHWVGSDLGIHWFN
jgi:hypothetical protein